MLADDHQHAVGRSGDELGVVPRLLPEFAAARQVEAMDRIGLPRQDHDAIAVDQRRIHKSRIPVWPMAHERPRALRRGDVVVAVVIGPQECTVERVDADQHSHLRGADDDARGIARRASQGVPQAIFVDGPVHIADPLNPEDGSRFGLERHEIELRLAFRHGVEPSIEDERRP